VLEATLAHARVLVAKGAGVRRTSERGVDPATATPEIIERLTAHAKKQYPNREAAFTAIKAVSAPPRACRSKRDCCMRRNSPTFRRRRWKRRR